MSEPAASSAAERPRAPSGGSIEASVLFASEPEAEISLGGLTLLDRAALALDRASVARVIIVSRTSLAPRRSPAVGGSQRRSAPEVVLDAEEALAALAGTRGRVLVLPRPVVLDAAAVRFLRRFEAAASYRVLSPGAPSGDAAGYVVSADRSDRLSTLLRAAARSSPRAVAGSWPAIEIEEGVFEMVDRARGASRARAALRRSLVKPTDGFFAASIDRRISARLSLRLSSLRVSPNAITLAALVPALTGAVLLALPGRSWPTAGALLYWLSTVLDGCDGEVARLTYRESPGGARLDLLGDNVALVALFTGIFLHVFRETPGATVPVLAAATLVGMLGCMITEYRALLRPRIEGPVVETEADLSADRVRWYERLASRDFAYLLPFFAAFGALRSLVWATAVGVNVFWLALTGWVLRPRRKSS